MADHAIALVRDLDDHRDPILRVVVGPIDGTKARAVTTLASTEAGKADATMVGEAVPRSFQLIEAGGGAP